MPEEKELKLHPSWLVFSSWVEADKEKEKPKDKDRLLCPSLDAGRIICD